MRRTSSALVLLALSLSGPAAGQVVINEIEYDQPGTDSAEYVELYNAGPSAVDLDTFELRFINGASPATPYDTISLPPFQLAAGDFYVVCANAMTVANCDLDDGPDTNFIQNGAPDAVALFDSASLADTVSYEGDTAPPYTETSGAGLIDPGATTGDSIGRCPDGWDTNVNNIDLIALATGTPGTPNACPGGVLLSIGDVAAAEGNSGTSDFTFTISVTGSPAGAVTFDATVDDGTATVADNDYVDQNAVPLSIVPPATSTQFTVQVVGDPNVEPNETFTVTLANLVNAGPGDTSGTGTIQNDDVTITPVHDIQGNGATSPEVGNVVTTHGIVTGVKSNAFFLQTPDAQADGDPATSEGILVFTGSAPAVTVGDDAQVTGTVLEFVPGADPFQPPMTEIGDPSLAVVGISSGNPLPAPVSLTSSLPDPSGAFDQLERLEGMRVSVASLRVVGPTLGSVDEPTATATTNGVFYGVVTGVARPFREPGVQLPDPLPPGSPANVPRFDTNPETIRVDSDAAGHAAIDVGSGAVLGGVAGPLDYGFRHYTIDVEAGAVVTTGGGPTPSAVSDPIPVEVTVAGYNLERFFDTVDDPAITEPVLTVAAFDGRLAKASAGIRDYLKFPDVVGVAECENLATLSALASRINADAVAAAQPDPQYAAYLLEGHDVGGIDVGFLVKTAPVSGTVPRVEVLAVAQEGFDTLFVNPDLTSEFLNDRPSLRLDAVVHFAAGESFPLTAIVNHLRSLSGINSESPGTNGWPTVGGRVRAKRQQQAEFLAGVVQARQTADPLEWLALVGDFNAFEFNDGFVDSMGTIAGAPAADDATVIPGDGADLVEPDLTLLDGAGSYSYVFDGNAQSLDHGLVNAALVTGTLARRLEVAHLNADFAAVVRNDGGTVARLSDHDPDVTFLQPGALDPDQLFRGDFESGDLRWWSTSVP